MKAPALRCEAFAESKDRIRKYRIRGLWEYRALDRSA